MFRGLWIYNIKMKIILILVMLIVTGCAKAPNDSVTPQHILRILTQIHN